MGLLMSKDPTRRQSTTGNYWLLAEENLASPIDELAVPCLMVRFKTIYTQRTKMGTSCCKNSNNIYEYVINIIKDAIKLRLSVCRRSLREGFLPMDLKIGGAWRSQGGKWYDSRLLKNIKNTVANI